VPRAAAAHRYEQGDRVVASWAADDCVVLAS
jgi:hypothetical protein